MYVCVRKRKKYFLSFLCPSMLVRIFVLTPTLSEQKLSVCHFNDAEILSTKKFLVIGLVLISYSLLQETLWLIICSQDRIKQWTRQ